MMGRYSVFLMISAALLLSQVGSAQTGKGRSHGVVVGIDQYVLPGRNDGPNWKNLNHAVRGARAVAALLEERGFEVRLLLNEAATRGGILEALEEVANQLAANDRVLFFFAGHGHTQLVGSRDWGYLVPHAGVDTASYISMRELQNISEQMGAARHQLFIMDACYSGHFGAFRSRLPDFARDSQTLQMYQIRRARQFITAGDKTQKVSDSSGPSGHSVFTGNFLEAIGNGAADRNNDGFITFAELVSHLETAASTLFQTPVYGGLPGDGGGSFLFAVKPGAALPRVRQRPVNSHGSGLRAQGQDLPVATEQPRKLAASPRILQIREGQPVTDDELKATLGVTFGEMSGTPFVTILIQTNDGSTSRQACYDGGTELAFDLGQRFFRGLLMSVDWQLKEVKLSLGEMIFVDTAAIEPTPEPEVAGQSIKYLQIRVESFEVLESRIRVGLKLQNVDKERRLAVAWFAQYSGGIADFWKFNPSVEAIVTDDQSQRYEFSSTTGLGFARTQEDWLVIEPGEESSVIVELRKGRGTAGKVFTFSAPIRLAWRPRGVDKANTGTFNIRLDDLKPK